MPIVVRALSFPLHWWPPLLMGALFGAGVSWLAVRRRARRHTDPEDRARRESNARARPTLCARLKRVQVEPDLVALTARLRAWPGAEEVRVRSFCQAICELVGSAGGGLYVADLIRVLTNRVWTPESGGAA
jgi:hypothetical protein